jgi:hypothetical protein
LHPAERSEFRACCRLNPRNRFEAPLQIAKEGDSGGRAVAAQAGIDLESDQPVSLESHIVAQQVHQAPRK